ncbi:hypothetical protein CERZMDRAFT_40220 [Cercospora zeae-maydis SCOH1-5]|uniref:Quinate transporter n=1 Tax=Cercospora zeae-maydis SCOH1-5 TaxID=717836 RepID=A0A6A6FHV3_9PEZI|nr:hypothetical protein CERZMDRAFT_40220 [Cercospora zeae-maydis SCOH1-5]
MHTPAPPEVYNWTVYCIAMVASMGAFLFGYDLAFIGTTITQEPFQKDFGLLHTSTSHENNFAANVVSLLQAGCFFGALLAAPIGDRTGRRWALIIAGIVFNAGSLMQTVSHGNVAAMFVGRFIGGLGVGAASMIVPMYVAELSPPAIRGRLVGIYEVFVQVGTCIGFWVNYGIAKHGPFGSAAWVTAFGIQLIPGGLLIIGMLFMPESPRWLARYRGREAAESSLVKLRKVPIEHPYLQEEMLQIMDQIDQELNFTEDKGLKATLEIACRKGNWNRLLVGMTMFIFMQFAGSNAINFYSPRIFKSLGLTGSDAGLYATGIYGVVRLFAIIIAMNFVVDRFGRTKMLMAGGAVMAFSMWFIGAYIKIASPDPSAAQHVGAGGYAAIVFIYIFALGFCFSYAGVPWIYASEIFPMNLRSLGMGMCTANHWLFNFVIARSTPYMISNIKYGTYFVFAGITTIGIFWVWFFVPETKGMTLEDMDKIFGSEDTVRSLEEAIHDLEHGKPEIQAQYVEDTKS